MKRRKRLATGGAIAATTLLAAASVAYAATQTLNLTVGNTGVVNCTRGSLSGSIVNNQWTGKCNATTTTQGTTTTTAATTTTTSGVTTTTGSGGAPQFVQDGDTGTFNGNTTSICSGCYNQVLAHNTTPGDTVVLLIQTLTYPGQQTDTIQSIQSNIGTFQFVNSYNDDADNEIWVCTHATGAADNLTVITNTNAWDAFAIEFSASATNVYNGGGRVDQNLNYLSNQSLTVTPQAPGDLVIVQADTLDAYTTDPQSPWTSYNKGYWDFANGTGAAWQIVPSTSPVTATWQTDGGLSSIQAADISF